jgi:hypothetical protein
MLHPSVPAINHINLTPGDWGHIMRENGLFWFVPLFSPVKATGAIESETSRLGIAEESADEQIANPLTGNEPSSAQDSFGRHRFIGNSSTWGFAGRVRRLLFTLPACATIEDQLDGAAGAGYAQTGESVPTEIRDARLRPPATSECYVSNYAYYIAPIWHFIDLSRHSNEIRTPAKTPRKTHSGVLWPIRVNLVLENWKIAKARLDA